MPFRRVSCLANGRQFRTANLKDDCTRECPAIAVAFSLPGKHVVAMLDAVRLSPADDATAFTAAQLRDVVERLTQAGTGSRATPSS